MSAPCEQETAAQRFHLRTIAATKGGGYVKAYVLKSNHNRTTIGLLLFGKRLLIYCVQDSAKIRKNPVRYFRPPPPALC